VNNFQNDVVLMYLVFLYHPKHAIPQVLSLTLLRVLISVFRLSQLGLLVGVFTSMLLDVSIFIIIYFILLVSCTFLFIGIAKPDLLAKGCMVDEDFTHSSGPMTCEVCIGVCNAYMSMIECICLCIFPFRI
jgi:hypothetical protein